MSLFFKPVLESTVEVPADLPEVNGEIGAEEIEQQVEDDRMDIVQAMHESDMEEIEHMKEVKDAEEAGASEEEIEKIEESWAIVREGKVKDFFNNLKEKLKLLWAKIKEFFKSIFIYLKSLFMSAKDFVAKYEKDLQNLASAQKLKGYEYNGFEYTIDVVLNRLSGDHTVEKNINQISTSAQEEVNTYSDDTDDDSVADFIKGLLAEYRSNVVSGQSRDTYDTADFSSDLYSVLRNGAANSNDTVTFTFNVSEVITKVKSLTSKNDSVKKIEAVVDKNLKKMESKLNELGKEEFNTVSDVNTRSTLVAKRKRAVANAWNYVKGHSAITTTAIGAVKVAINEQLNTLKRACAGAFTYARKQK